MKISVLFRRLELLFDILANMVKIDGGITKSYFGISTEICQSIPLISRINCNLFVVTKIYIPEAIIKYYILRKKIIIL